MTYQRSLGLCVFLLSTVTALAQPATRLEFEVASIKPAAPPNFAGGKVAIRIGMHVDGSRMEYSMGTLRDLIRTAYRVKDYQVSGPDWINDTRFDIVAKLPEGSNPDQAPEMLQALLADRFKLTLHHETKDHNVYALVVGKGGPKLKASEADDGTPAGATNKDADGPKGPVALSTGNIAIPNKSVMTFNRGAGGMAVNAKKVTLPGFADMLSRYVDRPVVDMTGIQGVYDFAMNLSMEEIMHMKGAIGGVMAVRVAGPGGDSGGPADAASDSTGPSVFQSVQQYGLKLDARKAPVDILTIDRAEKLPTEN